METGGAGQCGHTDSEMVMDVCWWAIVKGRELVGLERGNRWKDRRRERKATRVELVNIMSCSVLEGEFARMELSRMDGIGREREKVG